MKQADEIIEMLGMMRHPEGGHYLETFTDPVTVDGSGGGRAMSSAMLYLLKRPAPWHRIDSTEMWHWYAGAPLELSQSDAPGRVTKKILGNDILAGQMPQIVVPGNTWKLATSLGDWTLFGCTVAPGFTFDAFEQAPPGWTP